MERTQTLALDFTATEHGEAYMTSFSGDMNSNVVTLSVTPELEEGDILLCSFLRDNLVVDTLVIQNNSMTLPYSVLKNPGEYTAAFAVANLQNRLTATMTLTVRVAEDRVSLAPTEDYTDQSLICYILTEAASTARAAAEEVCEALDERVTAAEEEIDTLQEDVTAAEHDITALQGRVGAAERDIDGIIETLETTVTSAITNLQMDVSVLESDVSALETSRPRYAEGNLSISCETPYCCQSPTGYWKRIGNVVIVVFGFGSSGSTSFTLHGLPFACTDSYLGTPLIHVNHPSCPSDGKVDLCQTLANSTDLQIVRTSSSFSAMSGTLVYATTAPFPDEV